MPPGFLLGLGNATSDVAVAKGVFGRRKIGGVGHVLPLGQIGPALVALMNEPLAG